jgi:hypothetical protein
MPWRCLLRSTSLCHQPDVLAFEKEKKIEATADASRPPYHYIISLEHFHSVVSPCYELLLYWYVGVARSLTMQWPPPRARSNWTRIIKEIFGLFWATLASRLGPNPLCRAFPPSKAMICFPLLAPSIPIFRYSRERAKRRSLPIPVLPTGELLDSLTL